MNKIKHGGRTKGTPNLLTSELKTILNSLVQKELSKISETFEKLVPEKRLDYLIKLLPYILPKAEPSVIEPQEARKFEVEIVQPTLTQAQIDKFIEHL